MATNNSETSTISAPEPKQKQMAEPIYAHAVSWTWIIVGLACVILFVGGIGVVWYYQTRNMAKMVLAAVEKMVQEAGSLKQEVDRTDDPTKKAELITKSFDLRKDAANMLDKYRQTHPDPPSESVLRELYNILEGLYKDHGERATAMGIQRGEQLSRIIPELARIVSDPEARMKYQTRLLELEWDRRNLEGIIERGRELLEMSQKAGQPPNYDARRYIALALFEHLPVKAYNSSEYRLPSWAFPETMDELLGKLNSEKPGDIEVAKRYAEFIVSLDHSDMDRQRLFRSCSSEPLLTKSPTDRLAEATKVIDTMVQHNRDNPDAYLARYHFNTRFVQSDRQIDQDDPDLVTVLRLDPHNAEGLILSSIHAIRQATIAASNEEPARAADWHTKAEEYLTRTVKYNISEPLGYQYLGDFLLFIKNKPKEAIDIWDEGLKYSGHRGDEELIGRLVMVLLEQRMVEEVRDKLAHLERTIAEIRLTRQGDVRRANDMLILLTARLSNTEAIVAASKIEAAQRANRSDEVSRLFGIVQQKRGDAMQKFEDVLRTWGRSENDYVFLNEKRSVYSMLLPESLLQLGDLKLDWGEWDSAAWYFSRAARIEIPSIQRTALLKMSFAYQQGGRLDQATQALKALSDAAPEDLNLRYAYTTLLFRSKIASNTVDAATLDNIGKELETLGNRRSELAQPWAIDIRRIHLDVARANLSNSADTIVAAINEATRKFRALERGTFPPNEEGKEEPYVDDPAFVAELVGIYSSLSATDDYRRLLEKLRSFPDGGEDAYYEARINDCLRRDDKEGAVAVIDEASTSTRLSAARRERFVALLQTLKGNDAGSESTFERAYNQLKTTFDQAPESLKPQAFFILANMSLDKGNLGQAKQIRERLEKIEGKNGRNWQYIQVRIMLTEKDPDYARMRQIQEGIAGREPDWDMAYLLRTLIEEQYLLSNPDDPVTLEALIGAYRSATRTGNTQANVWQRLVELLIMTGNNEGAKDVVRQATIRGIMLETQTGQLPQPYGRLYSQVQEAIADENPSRADEIAQECIKLAKIRNAKSELIFSLNLALGKVFLDSQMYTSATRHLTETAQRGGAYIYPLAVCVAKSGDIDGGFTLLLDEIDLVPSALPTLLPAVLVLMAQIQPSEKVYERIDKLMERVERGERLILTSTLGESEDDHVISLGTSRVPSRKIQSFVIRFPEKTDIFDPSMIRFITPEDMEGGEDEPDEQLKQPAE